MSLVLQMVFSGPLKTSLLYNGIRNLVSSNKTQNYLFAPDPTSTVGAVLSSRGHNFPTPDLSIIWLS